jgi:hypothetical protein
MKATIIKAILLEAVLIQAFCAWQIFTRSAWFTFGENASGIYSVKAHEGKTYRLIKE